MAAEEITTERRQHSRAGVIGQLEDITYAALRKYGVMPDGKSELTDSSSQPPVAIH